MRRIKALLLLIVFTVLLISGCTSLAAPEDNISKPPESTTPEESVTISVDYATDELLNKYSSYINEYADLEYSEKIIISTTSAVREFRFIEIGFEEDTPDIKYFENEVLYSTDELLPENPLVVGVSFPGILPTRGIAFTDENNTARYFYIAMSGENGSLFLVEFE